MKFYEISSGACNWKGVNTLGVNEQLVFDSSIGEKASGMETR